MSNWQPTDLTGDPAVEEQIRQYYNKKKHRNPNVIFVEGIALEEPRRAKFSIDNSHLHNVSDEAKELHNGASAASWAKYYKGDKIRRRYEER